MQFTEQITVNNFYLFIRKYFEHASLQHLRIPVHLDICARLLGKAVEVSLAKLLLMQLEVRGKGNPGMPWGDCCSTAYSLFCGVCAGLCGSHCAGYVIEKKITPERVWVWFLFWIMSLGLQVQDTAVSQAGRAQQIIPLFLAHVYQEDCIRLSPRAATTAQNCSGGFR